MDIRGKKFLLIGGAGLIGSHTVDELVKEDVAEIRIFEALLAILKSTTFSLTVASGTFFFKPLKFYFQLPYLPPDTTLPQALLVFIINIHDKDI